MKKFVVLLTLLLLSQNLDAQTIDTLEYFIDADPGYGKGTPVTVTAGTVIDETFTVGLDGLSDGFHVLYVRIRDNKGVWSLTQSKPFIVEAAAPETSEVLIDRAEYFFDSDPGFGKGTEIPVTPGVSIDMTFVAELSGVSEGSHVLYVRIRDDNGVWSLTQAKPFIVEAVAPETSEVLIDYTEYFIDADPGFGEGTEITITPGTHIDETFVADLSGVTEGSHVLYVRVRDDNGVWSLTQAKPFFVESSPPEERIPDIVSVEYYFTGDDTETAPRIFDDFTPSRDIDVTFDADLTGLSAGKTYTIHTVLIDDEGKRSFSQSHLFSVVETSLRIVSPNGGEEWTGNSVQSITWTSSSINTVDLFYSIDGGDNWIVIAENIDAVSGSYDWSVPDETSSGCLVKITDSSHQSIADQSDETFGIVKIQPVVTLVSPVGGESWEASSVQNITWQSSGVDNVKLEYSTDNGTTWITITESTPASSGVYSWTVSDGESSECLVRISDTAGAEIADTSGDVFTVTPVPFLTLVSPDGGESWYAGSGHEISWESYGVETLMIEYTMDGGTTWNTVVGSTAAASGNYQWTIPETESVSCMVRITDTSDVNLLSVSAEVFTISAAAANGTIIWTFGTDDMIGRSTPAIGDDGTIYFGSYDNYLYAVNPDGTQKWRYKANDVIGESPAINIIGVIFFGSYDNYLYAINPDGSLLWKFKTDNEIRTSPAIDGKGVIYIGSHDTYLYAINPDGTEKWKFKTGREIFSTPAIDEEGTIYFGSYDKYLYALNSDGTQKWKYELGEGTYSSPTIDNTANIYIGCSDGKVYSVKPDGTLNWIFSTEWTVGPSPIIGVDNTIYIGSNDKYLYAINPDGSLKWKYQAGDVIDVSPVLDEEGNIYFGSWDGYIYALSVDGSLLWKVQTGNEIRTSGTITDSGILLIGSRDTNLYAIDTVTTSGIADSPWPKFQHDLRNTGSLQEEAPIVKSLTLINPNGGEELSTGKIYTMTWSSENIGTLKIEFSDNGGSSWDVITDNIDASSGSYTWIIPETESDHCYIRISDTADAPINDSSDSPFGIVKYRMIKLLSPQGGERWQAGTVHSISWESAGVSVVDIVYSTDNGESWNDIAADVDASAGKYDWQVPDGSSDRCLIKIVDAENDECFDVSDNVFTIELQPYLELTSPVGGEEWIFGTTRSIAWTSSGITTLIIEYSVDNGDTWITIGDTVSASAMSYSWHVPDVSSSICLVRISDVNGSNLMDVTDSTFSIVSKPYLEITSPNGGESLVVDDIHRIQWSSSGVTEVSIDYSSDGGESWIKVAEEIDVSLGEYVWTVPRVESSRCLVRLIDENEQALSDVSDAFFAIVHPSSVAVTAPNGSEQLTVGTPVTIAWTAVGVTSVRVEYSTDNGVSWNEIAPSVDAENGQYSWTVPDTPSDQCLVRLADAGDASLFDVSDDSFVIVPPASVTVSAPNGGEQWTVGASVDIAWTSTAVDTIMIEYSTDGGQSWIEIHAGVEASPGSYSWTVPDAATTQGMVRITCLEDTSVTDSSDQPFVIVQEPYVTIESPNGGEKWIAGTRETVSWQFNDIETVTLEYSDDDGTTWIMLDDNVDARQNAWSWTVPEIESSLCRVRITDNGDSTLSDMSDDVFTISPAAFLEVLTPAGDERWPVGTVQTITWSSSGIAEVTLSYSSDNGATWTEIAAGVDASLGEYSWTVPGAVSDECGIRMTESGEGVITDESEAVFSIIPAVYISLVSPADNVSWNAGATVQIIWNYRGVSDIRIALSTDNGATWTEIAADVDASIGEYSWSIPDVASDECKIRLSSVADAEIVSVNAGVFTIERPDIVIAHDPVTVAGENSPIVFSATVTSDTAIDSVNLYYDVTGRRTFANKKVFVTENGTDFSVVLPVGVFTAAGLEYYITARDVNGIVQRYPEHDSFFSVAARVSSIVIDEPVSGGSEQNAYRMISIPLMLTEDSIVDQLDGLLPQGDAGTDWRLFRYSKGGSVPDEYPDIEGFSPGKAFWLITTSDYTLASPEGETVTTGEPFTMTLAPGWNDIANPWLFDVSWEIKDNPSNATLDVLYTYEGEWSDPNNAPRILEPWAGYSVRNMENYSVVIRLHPEPVDDVTKPAGGMDGIVWQLSIAARAGEAADTANRIGVMPSASGEWDSSDHVEPPPVGQYVSVAFPHNDWPRYPYDYTVDFRPPGETVSWDIDVRTNISNEIVTVEFGGIDALSEDYDINVFDLDNGNEVNLADTPYTFLSADNYTERHLRLTVRTAKETEPFNSFPTPDMFVIATCYPNPFNPQTTLHYKLSHAGKVNITVFNTVGQVVKSYDLGFKAPGVYDIVIDTRDITSGLYIFRIDAGYAVATGKMVYLR